MGFLSHAATEADNDGWVRTSEGWKGCFAEADRLLQEEHVAMFGAATLEGEVEATVIV